MHEIFALSLLLLRPRLCWRERRVTESPEDGRKLGDRREVSKCDKCSQLRRSSRRNGVGNGSALIALCLKNDYRLPLFFHLRSFKLTLYCSSAVLAL